MKRAFAIVALASALLAGGCRTQDIRTVVIGVPGMRCAECAKRVEAALAAMGNEGVKADKLAFDTAAGTVTVTYDSMLVAIKNLEFAIAAAGYAVTAKPYPLPADPTAAAALPAPCREHVR